jgi:hypothetical protein
MEATSASDNDPKLVVLHVFEKIAVTRAVRTCGDTPEALDVVASEALADADEAAGDPALATEADVPELHPASVRTATHTEETIKTGRRIWYSRGNVSG